MRIDPAPKRRVARTVGHGSTSLVSRGLVAVGHLETRRAKGSDQRSCLTMLRKCQETTRVGLEIYTENHITVLQWSSPLAASYPCNGIFSAGGECWQQSLRKAGMRAHCGETWSVCAYCWPVRGICLVLYSESFSDSCANPTWFMYPYPCFRAPTPLPGMGAPHRNRH